MPKLKFEDYKAPWEKDLKEGEEPPELDHDEIKKLLFNLVNDKIEDKEKLQKKVDDVTKERDTFKSQLDSKTREGESEVDKLKRERDEALAKAKKVDEPDPEKLKLEVALDKGLNRSQMKRLVGTTKEELEADADEILELMPGKVTPGSEGEPGDDAGVITIPQSGLRNPGDAPKNSGTAFDPEALADAYQRRKGIF